MIKKIISVAFVAAILSVGAYSYTQSQHEKSINNLTLANVEALASGEKPEIECSTDCMYEWCGGIIGDGGSMYFQYCE